MDGRSKTPQSSRNRPRTPLPPHHQKTTPQSSHPPTNSHTTQTRNTQHNPEIVQADDEIETRKRKLREIETQWEKKRQECQKDPNARIATKIVWQKQVENHYYAPRINNNGDTGAMKRSEQLVTEGNHTEKRQMEQSDYVDYNSQSSSDEESGNLAIGKEDETNVSKTDRKSLKRRRNHRPLSSSMKESYLAGSNTEIIGATHPEGYKAYAEARANQQTKSGRESQADSTLQDVQRSNYRQTHMFDDTDSEAEFDQRNFTNADTATTDSIASQTRKQMIFNPIKYPSSPIRINSLVPRATLSVHPRSPAHNSSSIYNFDEILLPPHSKTLLDRFYRDLASPYISRQSNSMRVGRDSVLNCVRNTFSIIKAIADTPLWSIKKESRFYPERRYFFFDQYEFRLHRNLKIPIQQHPFWSITVQIYGKNALLHRHRELQMEAKFLATHTLADLRDVMLDSQVCWKDHYSLSAIERNSSSYFHIENVFFDDRRNLDSVSLSTSLQRADKHRSARALMHMTSFQDLEFRINTPYHFVHQDSCLHTVIFTQAICHTASDPKLVEPWPMLTQIDRMYRRNCKFCYLYPVKFISLRDTPSGEHPALWCQTCYKRFHYDKDILTYGGFDAYYFSPSVTTRKGQIKEGLQIEGSKWVSL